MVILERGRTAQVGDNGEIPSGSAAPLHSSISGHFTPHIPTPPGNNADKVVLTAKVATMSFYNNWVGLIADMCRKRKSCP